MQEPTPLYALRPRRSVLRRASAGTALAAPTAANSLAHHLT